MGDPLWRGTEWRKKEDDIVDAAAALEKRVEALESFHARIGAINAKPPKPERVRFHKNGSDYCCVWEECRIVSCGYQFHATFERVEE